MINLIKRYYWVILFYFIFTVLISWPLIFHLDGFLLSENYQNLSHSDTLKHIERMKNERDSMLSSNSFIGCIDCLEMSEVYSLFGIFFTSIFNIKDVVFHNLYFLFCIFLSGLFMYLFMLELSEDHLTAVFSGFLYITSNYLLHEYFYGHTNTISIQWIPLIFLLLEKILKCNKIKYVLFLAISFALQILSSSQYTVYLSFIIPLYLLLRGYFVNEKLFFDKDIWFKLFFSVIIALALSSFYLVKRFNYSYPIRSIEDNLVEFWRIHSIKLVFDSNSPFYIGFFSFLLILTGIYIVFSRWEDKNYKTYIPFAMLLLITFACMMGPFSYFAPYYWLYKIWPFIHHFRTPSRLFPLFSMSYSILASLFLLKIKKSKKVKRHRALLLVFIIFIIILFQVLNSPLLANHHIFYP